MAQFGHYPFTNSGGSSIENFIRGGRFQIMENGVPTTITARIIKSTADAHFIKFAIYEEGSNVLIAESLETSSTDSGTFDLTLPIIGIYQTLKAKKFYYLCAWSDSVAGTCILAGGIAQGNSVQDSESYGFFPDPLVPAISNVLYDIVCDYNPLPTPKLSGSYATMPKPNVSKQLKEVNIRLQNLITR